MAWIIRHKLLALLIASGVIYFFVNPPGRIGIARKGFVVYNRIPVCFLDCFIDPEGKLHLEADLRIESNVRYWFDNHLLSRDDRIGGMITLLVGRGFSDSAEIRFDTELLNGCRSRGFMPSFYSSPEAVERYNDLRDKGIPAALLLKVK